MSGPSIASGYSVVGDDERVDLLSVNSKELERASVASEAELQSSSIASEAELEIPSVSSQTVTSPDLDYSAFLDVDDKYDLSEHRRLCSSIIWRVVAGTRSVSPKFGEEDRHQLEFTTLGSRRIQLTINCFCGVLLHDHYADYTVRVFGKEVLEGVASYTSLAKRTRVTLTTDEKIVKSQDVFYIYVLARMIRQPEGVDSWVQRFVDRGNVYKFNDFTVKLRDGNVTIFRAVLAEFFPYFRAFFNKYPEENQIAIPEFYVETFKYAVQFVTTGRLGHHGYEEVGLPELAKLLGAPTLIAEMDHWLAMSEKNICQDFVLASKFNYPIAKMELAKIIGLNWHDFVKKHTELVKENIDLFLEIQTPPVRSSIPKVEGGKLRTLWNLLRRKRNSR
ncbi:unnamed protein product [Bursaphelenchus xylophilus]|uniref:(pine wood nematode) hypothetical protein n=1 Tax=Bursaphelenchus xylophilus TaxID=6326 RepID=A0A1I7RMR6_BURXY|nr:unnamed protein product [Bursaphelenchus xylophilus]CAG9125548.1 unnamed protein product [Bursaphelenchus xylophilus]